MPQTGGAAKAKRAMMKRYGAKKGKKVFYALANKRAKKARKLKGKRPHTKAQWAYKKKRRKR